jgi:hypothetical protein
MYSDNSVHVLLIWQDENTKKDVLKFLGRVGKCSHNNMKLNLKITTFEIFDYHAILNCLFDFERVRTVLIFESQFTSQVLNHLDYLTCWVFQLEVLKELINQEYYYTSFRINSYSFAEIDSVIAKFGEQAISYSY